MPSRRLTTLLPDAPSLPSTPRTATGTDTPDAAELPSKPPVLFIYHSDPSLLSPIAERPIQSADSLDVSPPNPYLDVETGHGRSRGGGKAVRNRDRNMKPCGTCIDAKVRCEVRDQPVGSCKRCQTLRLLCPPYEPPGARTLKKVTTRGKTRCVARDTAHPSTHVTTPLEDAPHSVRHSKGAAPMSNVEFAESEMGSTPPVSPSSTSADGHSSESEWLSPAAPQSIIASMGRASGHKLDRGRIGDGTHTHACIHDVSTYEYHADKDAVPRSSYSELSFALGHPGQNDKRKSRFPSEARQLAYDSTTGTTIGSTLTPLSPLSMQNSTSTSVDPSMFASEFNAGKPVFSGHAASPQAVRPLINANCGSAYGGGGAAGGLHIRDGMKNVQHNRVTPTATADSYAPATSVPPDGALNQSTPVSALVGRSTQYFGGATTTFNAKGAFYGTGVGSESLPTSMAVPNIERRGSEPVPFKNDYSTCSAPDYAGSQAQTHPLNDSAPMLEYPSSQYSTTAAHTQQSSQTSSQMPATSLNGHAPHPHMTHTFDRGMSARRRWHTQARGGSGRNYSTINQTSTLSTPAQRRH